MRLDAAGYLAPAHKPYLADVQRHARSAPGSPTSSPITARVDRDGKLAFLRALDVLSVPATYDEPKGMFLLEAMASGVPVVQPRRGAFTEIVEKTGGGLLVDADDRDALADGLLQLWRDPALRGDARPHAASRASAQHYSVAAIGRSRCSRSTSDARAHRTRCARVGLPQVP